MSTQTAKVVPVEIGDVATFFLMTGLLFKLNRQFFHPLGYELSVDWIDSKNQSLGRRFRFFDRQTNPTQIFDESTFVRGEERWKKTWKERIKVNRLRQQHLGYTIQSKD